MAKRKFRLTVEELIMSDPVLLAQIREAAEEEGLPVMTFDEALAWIRAVCADDSDSSKTLH